MNWKQLSKTQQWLFILLMAAVVPFAPEFIFLADLGGIELVFGFLFLYYKPYFTWFIDKVTWLKNQLKFIATTLQKSAFMQPKIFLTQGAFYSVALLLTSSVLFASIFWLPAMLFNTTLI